MGLYALISVHNVGVYLDILVNIRKGKRVVVYGQSNRPAARDFDIRRGRVKLCIVEGACCREYDGLLSLKRILKRLTVKRELYAAEVAELLLYVYLVGVGAQAKILFIVAIPQTEIALLRQEPTLNLVCKFDKLPLGVV